MAPRQASRDLRRSPRVDVLMHVKGELTELNAPVTIYNLSRSGFAVLSEIAFDPGQRLDFRLIGANGLTVGVSAEAVHRQAVPRRPGHFLTGFRFVPGRLIGVVPQALIDQLIDAVTPASSLI